jgi:hypothetical protein
MYNRLCFRMKLKNGKHWKSWRNLVQMCQTFQIELFLSSQYFSSVCTHTYFRHFFHPLARVTRFFGEKIAQNQNPIRILSILMYYFLCEYYVIGSFVITIIQD